MTKSIFPKIKRFLFPCQENNFRPKILESNVLFWFLIIIVVLKLFTLPLFIYLPKSSFFGAIVKSDLIQLLNQERVSLGLNPLKENPLLDKAAFLKAEDMIKKGYFAHQSPEGLTPWSWLRKVGYNYKVAGENLAIGFLDSKEVNDAWLQSPSHRANMLSPFYKEVGIAVVRGNFQNKDVIVVVQFFGSSQTTPIITLPSIKTRGFSSKQETNKSLGIKTKKEEKNNETKNENEVNNKGEEKTAVLGQNTFLENKKEGIVDNKNNSFAFKFFSFLNSRYYLITQIITYAFLIFVVLISLCSIFIKLDVQHSDLILKSFILMIILGSFLLVDYLDLIKLIPHDFVIR